MKKEVNTLPKPFIAPGSDVKPTKEELKKRQKKYNMLERIGVKTTIVGGDVDPEYENPYRIEAMILINQDKDVPEELIQKIEEYDKKILQLN